jgi:hypothetical protein
MATCPVVIVAKFSPENDSKYNRNKWADGHRVFFSKRLFIGLQSP